MGHDKKIIKSASSMDGSIKIQVADNIAKIYCNDKFLGQLNVEKNFQILFNNIYSKLMDKLSYIPISELKLQSLVREIVAVL